MNQPTTFQRSSSLTQESFRIKDAPQGDHNYEDLETPKTDFLRGLSGLLDTTASFDVLPHRVESSFPKPIKRVSIISSASETDTRSSDSDEDDDSWIDALCDVPVSMFDAIDPLPVFQDVLPTSNNTSSRKRSANDVAIPSTVTPAKGTNPPRRVSMEGFLPSESRFANPLKTPPPLAPKKKAPPPPQRPSILDSPEAEALESVFDGAEDIVECIIPASTYQPSQLFGRKQFHVMKMKQEAATIKKTKSIKKPPAIKKEQINDESFPDVSYSGRVRKSVDIYDPSAFPKSRKAKAVIKKEDGAEKADAEKEVDDKVLSESVILSDAPKEPCKKKRKIEASEKAESAPVVDAPVQTKSESTKKVKSLKKKSGPAKIALKKAKGKKVTKAGRTFKKALLRPAVLTPTKVKSSNIPTPLKLSEIPPLTQVKEFSKEQEESWGKKYQDFLNFKEYYGHTAVPHFYTPNLKLSRWVKRQRYQYKLRLSNAPSTMTDKRITLLNDAGFIWDSHVNVWMERYRELKQFQKKYGTTSITVNKTKSKKQSNCLAAWVKHQRRQYKLLQMGEPSHMTPERVELLDKIGFQWAIRTAPIPPSASRRKVPRRAAASKNKAIFEHEEEEDIIIKPDQVGSNPDQVGSKIDQAVPDQVGSSTVADL